jgi:hypothetical protein
MYNEITNKMIAQIPQATSSKEVYKLALIHNIRRFANYAAMCLRNSQFRKSANTLLPFDKTVGASISFDNSPLKKMGIVIMRMDLTESSFSLGMTIEFEKSEIMSSSKATIMLAACSSLNTLGRLVMTPVFQAKVRRTLSEQIDKMFHS